MIKKRRKFNNIGNKIANIFIGVGLGILLGWYLAVILGRFLPFDILIYSFLILIFGSVGLYSSLKKPTLTEKMAFGVSVFIFAQVIWDFGANDWSKWRLIMALSALVLFLVNLFTGYVKVIGGKKIATRQLGLGR